VSNGGDSIQVAHGIHGCRVHASLQLSPDLQDTADDRINSGALSSGKAERFWPDPRLRIRLISGEAEQLVPLCSNAACRSAWYRGPPVLPRCLHPDILRSAVLGFAYRRLDVIPRRQEM